MKDMWNSHYGSNEEEKKEDECCSICMEKIESSNKNCTTTDCGHMFNTNCLVQNVSYNGVNCPICRTAIADEIDKNDSDYEYDESDSDSSYQPDEVLLEASLSELGRAIL